VFIATLRHTVRGGGESGCSNRSYFGSIYLTCCNTSCYCGGLGCRVSSSS